MLKKLCCGIQFSTSDQQDAQVVERVQVPRVYLECLAVVRLCLIRQVVVLRLHTLLKKRVSTVRVYRQGSSVMGCSVIGLPEFFQYITQGDFGISKIGFGAGFGSLAVPLMALAVTVPQAAAILMPLLLLMDLLGLAAFRKKTSTSSS